MVWDPEDGNRSTYKPLRPEQVEELKRSHIEPRLEIVPSTPTSKINEIGRRPQPAPTPRERKPTTGIVYH